MRNYICTCKDSAQYTYSVQTYIDKKDLGQYSHTYTHLHMELNAHNAFISQKLLQPRKIYLRHGIPGKVPTEHLAPAEYLY
jgi:hypothetical protein